MSDRVKVYSQWGNEHRAPIAHAESSQTPPIIRDSFETHDAGVPNARFEALRDDLVFVRDFAQDLQHACCTATLRDKLLAYGSTLDMMIQFFEAYRRKP
jgi:hypothetical protein